jgi:hypothetical protein
VEKLWIYILPQHFSLPKAVDDYLRKKDLLIDQYISGGGKLDPSYKCICYLTGLNEDYTSFPDNLSEEALS